MKAWWSCRGAPAWPRSRRGWGWRCPPRTQPPRLARHHNPRRPGPSYGPAMSSRITDSPLYQHLWGTAEAREVLGDEGRLAGWLGVIAALARAQAAAGVIPASAADLISTHARADLLDVAYAAEQTRQTSHSMLGLIRALQAVLPEEAREYVYTGATVQDITDTWTALAIRRVGAIVWRDLRQIEERLVDLAVGHRSTGMAGRTHGPPGNAGALCGEAAPSAADDRAPPDRRAV